MQRVGFVVTLNVLRKLITHGPQSVYLRIAYGAQSGDCFVEASVAGVPHGASLCSPSTRRYTMRETRSAQSHARLQK